MYASIRRYEGIHPDNFEEITRRVMEGFLPIIRGTQGFIGYYIVETGDGILATVSLFQKQKAAEDSNTAAASWVKANLAALIPNAPQITAGEVTGFDFV